MAGPAPCLFAEAMPFVMRIYLIEIPESPDADVFFELDRAGFTAPEHGQFACGIAEALAGHPARRTLRSVTP